MYENLHCVIFSVILVFQLIKGLMNDAKLLITNSQLQSPLTKIRSVFTAKEIKSNVKSTCLIFSYVKLW